MSESNNSQNENSQPQNNEKYSKLKNELDEAKNKIDQIKDKQELETRRKRPTGIYIMSFLLVITGLVLLLEAIKLTSDWSFSTLGMFGVTGLSYLLLSVGIFKGIRIARISAMIIFTISIVPFGYMLVLFLQAETNSVMIFFQLLLSFMMAPFVIFIFYLRKSNVKLFFEARSQKSI